MRKSIIITSSDLGDSELVSHFLAPLDALDPSHPNLSPKLKYDILRAKYHNQLIADGVETGHINIVEGKYLFQSKLPYYSFAGFIFEAFAVRKMNENLLTVGRKAFEWCTKRKKTKSDYIKQFKVIGTGFVTTESESPQFYMPQHIHDIKFIRTIKEGVLEPATVMGTTNSAGIQVKAITCNEYQEIIKPLIERKYSNVLTFLRDNNGYHTYEKCMETITGMYRQGLLGIHERDRLQSIICSPEMLGIDQYEVDNYIEYIWNWFNNRAPCDINIEEGIGLEIKGFRYSGGILVPDNV